MSFAKVKLVTPARPPAVIWTTFDEAPNEVESDGYTKPLSILIVPAVNEPVLAIVNTTPLLLPVSLTSPATANETVPVVVPVIAFVNCLLSVAAKRKLELLVRTISLLLAMPAPESTKVPAKILVAPV